jgi:hypothetical protein
VMRDKHKIEKRVGKKNRKEKKKQLRREEKQGKGGEAPEMRKE